MLRRSTLKLAVSLAACAIVAGCSRPSDGPVVPEFGSTEPSAWVNGAPMRLASARGSVVLVEAWSPSCSTCMESIPAVLSLKGRYEAHGLRVVSVSGYEGDDPEEAKQIAETA